MQPDRVCRFDLGRWSDAGIGGSSRLIASLLVVGFVLASCTSGGEISPSAEPAAGSLSSLPVPVQVETLRCEAGSSAPPTGPRMDNATLAVGPIALFGVVGSAEREGAWATRSPGGGLHFKTLLVVSPGPRVTVSTEPASVGMDFGNGADRRPERTIEVYPCEDRSVAFHGALYIAEPVCAMFVAQADGKESRASLSLANGSTGCEGE